MCATLASQNPNWAKYKVDGKDIEFNYVSCNPDPSLTLGEDNTKNVITLRYEKNDIKVTKTASNESPIIKDEFNYTIKVDNPTSSEVKVTITDTLNEKLDYLGSSDGGKHDEDTRTVTWTNVTVPANGNKVVSVFVKANRTGKIVNEAEAKIDGKEVEGKGDVTVTAKREFVLNYHDKLASDTGAVAVTNMPSPNPSKEASEEMSYTMKISGTVPQRKGYNFKHWQWGSDLTETYAPGAEIELTASAETVNKVTAELYAVWEKTDDLEVKKERTSGNTPKPGDTIT